MKLKVVIFAMLFSVMGFAQQNTVSEIDAYMAAKEFQKAEQLLLIHHDIDKNAILRDKLGEVYAQQGKWDKAIPIYSKLKEEYPKNAEYWFRYGGVLAKKAQSSSRFRALTMIGRIKSSFIKAANLDSKHVDTRWALVDLYLSLPGIVGGSVSKARKYAGQLKEISLVDGYLALGYVYEYDDEPGKARINYLKGLEFLDGLDHIGRNQLRYQIGKVCGDYGVKVDEGIRHMEEFVAQYSVKDGVPIEWAYYRLARLYRQKMDKKKADEWIEKALTMRGDFELAIAERDRISALP
ncbi:tetratricopeptide repeat protein [Spongiimicrobium salis]|uniref:tetratricopeptide repeat protein n=1 Tax=Spongiimicrobium salis TaxID=1667022 RepID=UPI00374D76D5